MMPNTHTNRTTIKIFKVTTTIIINITHSTITTTTTPTITGIATIIKIMKIIVIQIDKIIWDREWKRREEIRKIRLVRCWSKFKIRIRNNLLTIRFLSKIIVIWIEITTQTLILFWIITLIIIITLMIVTTLYKTTKRIIMIILMKNTTI